VTAVPRLRRLWGREDGQPNRRREQQRADSQNSDDFLYGLALRVIAKPAGQ
jgi:hypothetical protein